MNTSIFLYSPYRWLNNPARPFLTYGDLSNAINRQKYKILTLYVTLSFTQLKWEAKKQPPLIYRFCGYRDPSLHTQFKHLITS